MREACGGCGARDDGLPGLARCCCLAQMRLHLQIHVSADRITCRILNASGRMGHHPYSGSAVALCTLRRSWLSDILTSRCHPSLIISSFSSPSPFSLSSLCNHHAVRRCHHPRSLRAIPRAAQVSETARVGSFSPMGAAEQQSVAKLDDPGAHCPAVCRTGCPTLQAAARQPACHGDCQRQ